MLHSFNVNLEWEKLNEGNSKRISKSHKVLIDGKPHLDVSAAKSFKGDPTLYNPEDLLLSSLTSCHMMSYLYCCSISDIDVIAYQDESEAILEVNPDGSGKITKVILRPRVEIRDEKFKKLAMELHQKASELCFIANSCNFPVDHEISIEVRSED